MKSKWPTALIHVAWGTGVVTGILAGAIMFNGTNVIIGFASVIVLFSYYQLFTSIRSWRRRTDNSN